MRDEENNKNILNEQLSRVDTDPSAYARTEEIDTEIEKRKYIIEAELEARKKLEKDLEKEVDEQLNIIRDYLKIKLWRQALTKLKFVYDSPHIPKNKKVEVENFYREAHKMMEQARETDSSVPLFSHFNLPTKDVM